MYRPRKPVAPVTATSILVSFRRCVSPSDHTTILAAVVTLFDWDADAA